MSMDRYRTIVKLEEIRSLFEAGDYEAAKAATVGFPVERVKDVADLFLLSDVYQKNQEYTKAKLTLKRIYDKKPTFRVLEALIEVCLADKNPQEANMYLKEFSRISGGDPRGYIYEYRIGRQMRRPYTELLPVLQTLKAEEYTEKYAYELAKLYYRLGRQEECIKECEDIILWFGNGVYVDRAKALLAYFHGELSAEDIAREAELQKQRITEPEGEEQRAEGETEASESFNEAFTEAAASSEDLYEETEETEEAAEYDTNEDTGEPDYEPTESSSQEKTEEDSDDSYEPAEITEPVSESEEYSQMTLFGNQMEEIIPEPAISAMEEINSESAINLMEEEKTEQAQPAYIEEDSPAIPEEKLSEPSAELNERLTAAGVTLDELFREFAVTESVRKQLIRLLEVVISVRKRCQCLVITGEQGSGKTTLGTYLARMLYSFAYIKSPKVAKIKAEKLNQMDLFEKQEKLRDCCLIIEKAGELTGDALQNLLRFINETDILSAVILEDEPNEMNRLMRTHLEMNRSFNNRIHLPKYSKNELIRFACLYLEEQDYMIENEELRLLSRRIDGIIRSGQKEGRLSQTMSFVKAAVKSADERNQEELFSMAQSGKIPANKQMKLLISDFPI